MTCSIAVYAGSFDPFTLGHLDLVQRSLTLFDEVHVLLANNTSKAAFLPLQVRKSAIQEVFVQESRVSVKLWEGLTIDYLKSIQATALIRGVRSAQDFENEYTLSQINKKLYPQGETCLLPASSEWSWLSSSVIREMVRFKRDVAEYLPTPIYETLQAEGLLCLD